MHLRVITLAIACLALAFGGWEVSNLRAGQAGAGLTEVLVAAGGEPGFISGGEVQSDDRSYRLSALSVFSNVALHVKDNYVDPERIKPKDMLVAALEEIERQVAEVLVEDLGNGKVRVRVVDQELVVMKELILFLLEIILQPSLNTSQMMLTLITFLLLKTHGQHLKKNYFLTLRVNQMLLILKGSQKTSLIIPLKPKQLSSKKDVLV